MTSTRHVLDGDFMNINSLVSILLENLFVLSTNNVF